MSVLTIQGPAERGRVPERFDIPEGGNGTFGACACTRCALDIRIVADSPLQFRGEVTGGRSVWWIANLSDYEPLSVSDVDDTGSATVRPGDRLPFGFDMAIVRPLRAAKALSVTVFAAAAPASKPRTGSCPEIWQDEQAYLDPRSRYFSVLEILYRPHTVGGPIPTSADIAVELDLSPRAVDAHIDYLIARLGIPAPARRSAGWKRSALVAYVHARGLDMLRRGRLTRSTQARKVLS
ncbi:hypothetical protein JOF56_006852 [Kibdelosporangium banguiense]|uniref:FHA domain-containing protein n=1 Tax=Kibdelosporangium banguiense TaxID=1365924 RepID=A0ABS4TPY9_9PSEU|nr:hypothetical protein [Kibdelosporangium banguiense]MBP2326467.1 hypothetical protein [Kibdelosporangium banguiense]